MTKERIKQIMDRISIALHASHGLTATDRPQLPTRPEITWVIDHSTEIAELELLESFLKNIECSG